MSKKPRSHQSPQTQRSFGHEEPVDVLGYSHGAPTPTPHTDHAPADERTTMRVNSFTDLGTLRAEASARRTTTAQTIAELIEWRSEIDATIAYLRAQEK